MTKLRILMAGKQYKLWHLLYAITIAAGFVWAIRLGVTRTRHNMEVAESSYAARLVAQMCVEHMKANAIAWPKNWEELEDDFELCLARSGQTWNFADLQERIDVDWNVNPNEVELAIDAKPVVWVASDPSATFYGLHPNEIVSRYLAAAMASED